MNDKFPSKRVMLRIAARLKNPRYEGDPPELLREFVESDIRQAGLGALAMRHRLDRRGAVRRMKEFDAIAGKIIYRLEVLEPARQERGQARWASYGDFSDDEARSALTVDVVTIPARLSRLWLDADPRQIADDFYRAFLADQLMEARRMQRAERGQRP
jgi:hypothetical protein